MGELTPGRWWQRLLALLLGGVTLALLFRWRGGELAGWWVVAAAVPFLLFLSLWSAGVYRRWMGVAEMINVWLIRFVFTVIYFAVIPFLMFLRLKDRLRVRNHASTPSFWVKRDQEEGSLESLGRMG